eukprot:scaffold55887_cov37-Attheya_sp.AAC.1
MKIYDKYLELPSGENFTDEITVKEYHPPRAASKITCYVALKSKVKFNEIKYANTVMEFLKKNQIYLRVDNYNNSPDWMEAHENIYDSENNAEGNHPIPFFRLTSGKRNFRGVSTN